MDINLHFETLKDLENENIRVDVIKFKKMLLFFNSIEQGWSVKKREHTYVFTKNHEGKKEVLEDTYLTKFMNDNLDINKILS